MVLSIIDVLPALPIRILNPGSFPPFVVVHVVMIVVFIGTRLQGNCSGPDGA